MLRLLDILVAHFMCRHLYAGVWVFSCTFCCFRYSDKQTFIRHVFEAHCFKENFYYRCIISSCSHVFITGATYASFLTHFIVSTVPEGGTESKFRSPPYHHHTNILHESLETSINRPQSDQHDSSADNVLSEVEMSNNE